MLFPPRVLTRSGKPQCGQVTPLGQREASITLRASSSLVKAGLLRSKASDMGSSYASDHATNGVFSQVHNRHFLGRNGEYQGVVGEKIWKCRISAFWFPALLRIKTNASAPG